MLGGNHLANLLSTGKKYYQRFDTNSYDRNVSTAHFSYIREMNLEQITAKLDQLKTQSNVFNAHYMEYLRFRESDLVEYFPNKKFLAIQIPEPGTVALKEQLVEIQQPAPLSGSVKVSLLYQVPNIKFLCQEADRPWYNVSTNLLFDPDISKLFENLAQQGLEIDIDMDLIQDLHTKWFNRL
jgi:hypothetical protein